MKFIVSMKDPDGLLDAIQTAVLKEVAALPGLDEEERKEVFNVRQGKVETLCAKWFSYSEYLMVEIDTEAETCTVIPRKRRD